MIDGRRDPAAAPDTEGLTLGRPPWDTGWPCLIAQSESYGWKRGRGIPRGGTVSATVASEKWGSRAPTGMDLTEPRAAQQGTRTVRAETASQPHQSEEPTVPSSLGGSRQSLPAASVGPAALPAPGSAQRGWRPPPTCRTARRCVGCLRLPCLWKFVES